jgi:hypothetical protein
MSTPGIKAAFKRKVNLLAKAEQQGIDTTEAVLEYLGELEEFKERTGDKLDVIYEAFSYTTLESFTRYGDRNQLTNGMILQYIRKDAMALDVQAMYMSAEGIEITPEDLVQFMCEHPRGKNEYAPAKKLSDFCNWFKECFGFNIDRNFARAYTKQLQPVCVPQTNEYPF